MIHVIVLLLALLANSDSTRLLQKPREHSVSHKGHQSGLKHLARILLALHPGFEKDTEFDYKSKSAAIPTEYCERIARNLEFLRIEYDMKASREEDARWKVSSTSKDDGLETATLENPEAEFVTVRGSMDFPGITPIEVLNLIVNCAERTAWDDMLQEGSFEKQFGTVMVPPCTADIIHLIYKGMLGVAGRDLCLLRAWGEETDGTCWLVAQSCGDACVPETDDYVRAELLECGYMISATPAGCRVVYISQTNFKGWIPSFLQNVMMMQQPQSLRNMYRVLHDKAPYA